MGSYWRCSSFQARKNMLGAQKDLLENISDNDFDHSSGLCDEGSTEHLIKPTVARRRANLQEVENGYIAVS